jgi:hypothetical protein
MSILAPARARQSYRHEAFLWHSRENFVEGLLPFVRGGIDAGEAVMVAVTPEHAEWVCNELGAEASQVHFVDMMAMGRNPSRIIAAWQRFLDDWCGYGRPARGIGEPIWPGRRPEEILECQLHEALLNLAVDPELPFWLMCPYDQEHLDHEIIAEAERSHPAISTATSYHGSPSYRGSSHAHELFTAALPRLDGPPAETVLTPDVTTPGAAADYVTLQAASADLWSDKIVSLTDVVRQLTAGSVLRGAEQVHIRVWNQPQVLICDVEDATVIDDLLTGRRATPPSEHGSLWIANQLCDLVQARSNPNGTTIRLHMRK